MTATADHWLIPPARRLAGEVLLPGDKSISHRALILSALSPGTRRIEGLSTGQDVVGTARILGQLGVPIDLDGEHAIVGDPPGGRLQAPTAVLDCGNSGTTMRLMAGVLAGQPFESTLTGDASLLRRPMRRISEPLRRMGAFVDGPDDAGRAPLTIVGGGLRAIDHVSEVASAQVKSCLLLAGLFADGRLGLEEPARSRDHTERMLGAAGVELELLGRAIRMRCGQEVRLPTTGLRVPRDVSAAAFFFVAAYLVPGSRIELPGVGHNATRTGFLDAIASISRNAREELGEEVVDLVADAACHDPDEPLVLRGPTIPRLIDEIPVLAVLAARRRGVSRIRDAADLRAKESDRIKSTAAMLRAFGVDVRTLPDGMDIHGDPERPLRGGCTIDAASDHRVAMAAAVGALAADAPVTITNVQAVDTSFPGFLQTLEACRER